MINGDVANTITGTLTGYTGNIIIPLSAGTGKKTIITNFSYAGMEDINTGVVRYVELTGLLQKYFSDAATSLWLKNVCNPGEMTIQYLSPRSGGAFGNRTRNTLYVLNSGNYITTNNSPNSINDNCLAIVGSGTVTRYNTLTPSYTFYATWIRNIIIDNIRIDGTNSGLGGKHTTTNYGIYL